MIRAEAQVEEIAESGMTTADLFRGMSALNTELLKDAQFRKADITFKDTYTTWIWVASVIRLIAMGFKSTPKGTPSDLSWSRMPCSLRATSSLKCGCRRA